jgi:predicted dehydrogenase
MIRIGVVGCGRILAAHLRGYRLLRAAGVDNFRITALCARRESDARMYVQRGAGPPQREAVSRLPGDPLAVGDEYLSDFQPGDPVEVFTDFRQMIAAGPIDAVNDFSTHSLHHQVALTAFAGGKHLLTQKPLAISMEAGRRMSAAAGKAGLTFGVFESFRTAPSTRHLRAAFGEAGPLGPLQMILVGYAGLWWAPNLIVAETPWRHSKLEAGGISLDLGVHFFDQIRYLAGEIGQVTARTAVLEPRRVMLDEQGGVRQAIDCDADDTFFATAETESGMPANLFASWAGHGGPTLAGDGMAYYGAHGLASGDEAAFDDGRRVKLAELYAAATTPEQQARDFPFGLRDNFALSQLDWLRAIADGRQPETSGDEGLRDLAAAFAILESHHAGRRVAVADVLSGRTRAFQRPLDEHFGLL